MKMTPVRVCDVCGKDATESRYRVARVGSPSRVVDLCEEHSECLEEMLNARHVGGRRARSKVVTLEDIEALKLH